MKQKHLDIIYINNLKLPCLIGVFDFERKNKQEIIINIALSTDLRKAGKTDNINYTINYKDIYEQVVSLVETSNYFLIEKLAEEIAKICLKNKKVKLAKISIEKPKALSLAKSASIEITRTNE